MRLVGGSLAALAALFIAVLVFGDLIASATGLIGAAGWYAPIALSWPALMTVVIWRNRERS